MKNFTMADLKRLMDIEGELCMSLYMPTDPTPATADEHRIRFKNLLRQAENTARERAPANGELSAALAEGRRLLENDFFWRRQGSGLAVFIAPGVFLFHRLPVLFAEAFTASNRFAVKPLLPYFTAAGRFYILALSQSRVRLFSCTRHHVMEIELVDVPEGLEEALQYDTKQPQLQFHTQTAGGRGPRPAMFHGHGVGTDDRKDEILRYFRKVDLGLAGILPDIEVPLVLAGVDFLLPIFRRASSYQWLLEHAVCGNPDGLKAEELHKKALDVVLPELGRGVQEAAGRYRELAGKGATAAGVREVVPAAAYGRVETLFAATDESRPGAFDRKAGRVIVGGSEDPNGWDLLDLAVAETIRHGGRVYAVKRGEMPDPHAAAAAILRF